ncbi:ATP-dependent Clp protease proteolytic subunit [Streptomyces sp. NBC_00996]|uniref:phosphorylase family protein n=1 Tax=Streptomyces sp. NBC_00996 TaxID=2903710 RepID=UPI00386CFFD2
MKPDIQAVCIGQAASAAAVLLGAGTPGKGTALPGARVLLHQPHSGGPVLKSASSIGTDAHDGGTMVVAEGPRFSSRAESQWYAAAGWALVNMTGHPEAVLARELALCYTAVALVTDHDAGIQRSESVDQETVFAVFQANLERLRAVILGAAKLLPEDRMCTCVTPLDGLRLPFELP